LASSTAAKPAWPVLLCIKAEQLSKSQLIHPESKRGKPYMFSDQLNERNTMVQSNLAFEEPVQTSLAGSG
jgi:hypothetical protein